MANHTATKKSIRQTLTVTSKNRSRKSRIKSFIVKVEAAVATGDKKQAQQAFQAAQLKGIKSRFLYLPDENHWVLSAQNALVWQREFYKWLDETLK